MKIRVSLVRFRDWPPRISRKPSFGVAFLFGGAGTEADDLSGLPTCQPMLSGLAFAAGTIRPDTSSPYTALNATELGVGFGGLLASLL